MNAKLTYNYASAGNGRLDQVNWDDIRVPATSAIASGASPPTFLAWIDGVRVWTFVHNLERELFFQMQLPHGYKFGTDLHAHVHWIPAAAGDPGELCNWGLEYVFQEIGGVFAASSTTISGNVHTPADNSLIADKHYLTPLGVIGGSAVDSVSAVLNGRIFRDGTGALGTDDFGESAGLLEMDFHFQMDSIGSLQETVK